MKGRLRPAVELLKAIGGVRDARALEPSVWAGILAAEARYEHNAALPISNVGIRSVLRRDIVVALLKDSTFRPPPCPTLYLVEECAGEAPEHQLLVADGGRYRIIGEELLPGRGPSEGGMIISDGFVMYTDRRTDASLPSLFVLPPVRFPELEEAAGELGIRDITSASPSPPGDEIIRACCVYPRQKDLATLLVGFDPTSPW